jgi:hypothetical protein
MFINEFKKILVFFQIHHFTKTRSKAVAVTCTESQFFATFGSSCEWVLAKNIIMNLEQDFGRGQVIIL